MTRANLRFANDLLKRLGEELTPSPVNGIVELVKNAYDADASRCDVTLSQPSQAGKKAREGTLTISDDGVGMTESDFLNGWLLLGRSRKTSSQPTARGRRPVGDKGLGRLAAMRMGRTVRVVSRPQAEPGTEYELLVQWDQFERTVLPNEVPLELTSRKVPKATPFGTVIEISQITRPLNLAEIESLNRGLMLIANPFLQAKDRFGVHLKVVPAPEVPLVKSSRELLKECLFRLEGKVDARGRMSAVLYDGLNRPLTKADHKSLLERFKESDAKELISARFDLWIYVFLESNFGNDRKRMNTVKAWLRDFGGVHVFVDGVRVAPYGDPNDDWIGMNALRASSPELSPTTRSSIGYLTLTHKSNIVQKTDRTGFILTPSFAALREFIRTTLRWQQSYRIGLRQTQEDEEERERRRTIENVSGRLSSIFSGLESGTRKRANNLLAQLASITDKREGALKREIELYRTLGTAGIAASVFAHEASSNQLARIRDGVQSISFKVKKANPTLHASSVSRVVERILKEVDGLTSVARITLDVIRARKRKPQQVVLAECISNVVAIFQPYFELHDVKAVVKVEDKATTAALYGSWAAVECALVNLVTNALQAIDRKRPDAPRILIELSQDARFATIDVSDNGPGIVDLPLSDIWLPGETSREDGTGLGLAIVKAAVRDLGGRVSGRAHSDLGGAGFSMTFPLTKP